MPFRELSLGLLSAFWLVSTPISAAPKCSDVVAGLDGDLIWQSTERLVDIQVDPNSKIIVVNDGALIKGVSTLDGRVRWDFKLSEYFSAAQAPIVVRDGARLYLVGIKKMIELNAETGDYVTSYSVPFIQRPLPHDIVMGVTFPHRSNPGGLPSRLAHELLEQAATDRSFYLLDDWFMVIFEEGIRFMNRKGGAWKEKGLAGFIGANHTGTVEPHIFADRDQFVTSFNGSDKKNAKLEAFRFNYPEATFLREWSFELSHPLETTDYQFASNGEQVFAVTFIPSVRSDGISSKRLIAVDRNLGEPVWEKPLMSTNWQNHYLTATKSMLFYALGDQVIGVETKTGRKVWSFEIIKSTSGLGSPQLQLLDEQRILVQKGDQAFILRGSDGRLEADLKLHSPAKRDAIFNIYPMSNRSILLHAFVDDTKSALSMIRLR